LLGGDLETRAEMMSFFSIMLEMEVIEVARHKTNKENKPELFNPAKPTCARTKNNFNDRRIDQNLHAKQDQLLYESLNNGSYDQYNEAILLSQYRDLLVEQAMALRGDIENDIVVKSKKIKPIIYGRKQKIDHNVKELDYEEMWNSLGDLEAYEYGLENPQIYEEFFDEMKEMWVKNDLQHIRKEVVDTYCQWILPKPKVAFKKTKPKIFVRRDASSEPKKTTSQIRMEKDLHLKEEELQISLNSKFKANPIPGSSLEKRYDRIMNSQGTRTTKERELLARTKIQQIVEQKTEIRPKKEIINPIISKAVLATSKKKKHVYKDKELTFQPKITKHIPDYQKLNYQFISKLQARKNSKSPTIIKPFKGVEMNEILSREKRLKAAEESIKLSSKPTKDRIIESKHKEKVVEPRMTLSSILRIKDREMKIEADLLIKEITQEITTSQQLKQQVFYN
jgi:hypothetical protein